MCFDPDLTYEERINSRLEYHSLFQDNALWKQGDIPLLNKKIFKGTRVTIREHPYIASIRRNIMHYSVAAMLTKNLFITVAHPLIDVPIEELGVVVGENYADRGATLLTVILLIIHEHFDRYTLEADLALIRVFEDSPYRCSVKAIELIHPNKTLSGHTAFVTGWGRCDRTGRELCLPRSGKYTPGEKFDPMLRSVSFVIHIPSYHCEAYKRNGVSILSGMTCVGRSREAEKVASCLAVPGAPLVLGGHLVGLQSWGYGCGYKHDLPLIYTSMQYYEPWLLHNVPLIRRIYKENLTVLFEAKRAYILTKWLNMTRVLRPEPSFQFDKPMEMLKLDKQLAELRGRIYDIRDFLFDGVHHKYKTKLYEKLREKIFNKISLEEALHTSVTPQLVPFITPDLNETELTSVESLFIKDITDRSENESDFSYDEYD